MVGHKMDLLVLGLVSGIVLGIVLGWESGEPWESELEEGSESLWGRMMGRW